MSEAHPKRGGSGGRSAPGRMADLDGRVTLVTGAAGRIGRATAQTLASQGATVVASDLSGEGLDATAELLGADHTAIVADLSEVADVERLVAETASRYGGLDILVNNAAVLDPGGRITDCSVELYERIMAVNARAPFVAIRAAIPLMLERGGGAIVNLASVLSLVALPGYSAYCTSKGAIAQLTRSVAVDYAKDGIRCNAVCPGTIARPQEREGGALKEFLAEIERLHPIGRTGDPSEVAEVIAFLASDRASFMTGALVTVDGGFTTL